MSTSIQKDVFAALFNYFEQKNTDVFVYTAPIERGYADKLIDGIRELKLTANNENFALFLTTDGGDADAAYKIARYIKNKYKSFSLHVLGICKSAGTLIALGADEVIMYDHAEFGPLDVQIQKNDDLNINRTSGLSLRDALGIIENEMFSFFENSFLEVKKKSGFQITTHTAGDIASKLAVGLFSPIVSNLNLLNIGETERSMRIALEYGYRLCGNKERVQKLVWGYPSHSFVIDYDEICKDNLLNARRPQDEELICDLIFTGGLRYQMDFVGILGDFVSRNFNIFEEDLKDINTETEKEIQTSLKQRKKNGKHFNETEQNKRNEIV